jgi:hypothetical protein
VYLWRHDGQAVYVGSATILRGRAWSKHLSAGLSLSGSSLRRNVSEPLFGIPPNITGRPTKQKVTNHRATGPPRPETGCSPASLPAVNATQFLRLTNSSDACEPHCFRPSIESEAPTRARKDNCPRLSGRLRHPDLCTQRDFRTADSKFRYRKVIHARLNPQQSLEITA